MNYQIRKVTAEDIVPALDLMLNMFIEFDAPVYGPEYTERMRAAIADRRANTDIYFTGERLMYVALDGKKVIGVIETYGTNQIALLFVDSTYHRQGLPLH